MNPELRLPTALTRTGTDPRPGLTRACDAGLTVVLIGLLTACSQPTDEVGSPAQSAAPNAQPAESGVNTTPWGHPDLQGVYTFATTTPLERPERLGDKASYTSEELEELETSLLARRRADEHDPAPGSLGAAYNTFWTENETGRILARTSMIVAPENGRLPALTENGRAVLDAHIAEMADRQYGEPPFVKTAYRTWTDLPPYERCVARPIPRIFQAYNHGAQILQTPTHVVIHYESMHDARIVPVDGRPPLHDDIRNWNGEPRGRWEGDTLVIETTNFGKQTMDGGLTGPPLQFPMDNIRITERFRRLDDSTLSYSVTVEDPGIWVEPWTFELPWIGDDPNYALPEHLYEFACHEGNYRAMENTLRGSYDALD